MSRSYRSSSRSGSAADRGRRRFDDRDNDIEDEADGGDGEDGEEVKPYKAVGAALDSAERFRRRMNYGRVTQKP